MTSPAPYRARNHRLTTASAAVIVMHGAGLQSADAGIPRVRAVHWYPYLALPSPLTCSRAPQFPQNPAPVSNRRPFGARLPSRFGAVALARASRRSEERRVGKEG